MKYIEVRGFLEFIQQRGLLALETENYDYEQAFFDWQNSKNPATNKAQIVRGNKHERKGEHCSMCKE